jgi:hypothetical protein
MEPRVLISLITLNDLVFTETVKSIMALDLDGVDHAFHWIQHSITSAARNCAAAKAAGEGFTHLLFLDMDMTFDPKTVKRLLSHDVDIVSGMYRARRGDPGPFFAFNFHETTGVPYHVSEIDMTGPDLLEVQGLPTGCLLIRSDVFTRLDDAAAAEGKAGPSPGQPYFYYEPRTDRLAPRLVQAASEACRAEEIVMQSTASKGDVNGDSLRFKPGFGRGEDLRFCASCVEAGVKLFLDTRVVCGHLAMHSYGKAAIYA